MPAPAFEISKMLPLSFFIPGFQNLPQYRSKHYDDFRYPDDTPDWVTAPFWKRVFQQTDRLQLQVFSALGPVLATLVSTSDGGVVFSANFQQKQQSFFQPGWFIYELDWDLSVFPAPNTYELQIKFGSGTGAVTVVSDEFELYEVVDGSYLVEYSHYREKDGIYFETGFKTQIRTLGSLDLEDEGEENIVYVDQEEDPTLVNSKTWDLFRFYIGDSAGIPPMEVARWRMILGCQTLAIDGRLYTKAADGSKLEPKTENGYALKGWSIQLRDKLNRSTKMYEQTGNTFANQGLIAVIAVETKGFVADDNGGSFYNVPDIA